MSNSSYALNQLSKVLSRIENACHEAGRAPESVRLVGASKRQTSQLIANFASHGLADTGENYLQEAIDKQARLSDHQLTWHFIGQIQSNKTKLIAENFDWVHGVDRLKIAQRLATQNPKTEPLKVLLQLNMDKESSKGGVSPQEAPQLCAQIDQIDGIDLCGFTLIPRARECVQEQRAVFSKARQLLEHTNQQLDLKLDQLSMGMSGDLEAAIAEGSTLVRIGTDLFGARS